MHLSTIITTLMLSCAVSAYIDVAASGLSHTDNSDIGKRDQSDAVLDASILKRQSGPKTVQIVTVSDNNGTLRYFPENIQADVGSIVQFQFYPKNHTITESSFAAPCMPLAANLTSATRPGQRSGFVPVSADTQFRPVYNMLINDTKPIWIYCGQVGHCAKGMAMVVNQNMTSPNTLDKYKANAAALASASASSASGSATTSMPYGYATGSATMTSQSGPSLGSTTSSAPSSSASVGTFKGDAASMPRSAGWLLTLMGAFAILL